jgi:hypothetical protein
MSETINEIMDRVKSLREFTIVIDIPDGTTFGGVIPFDVTISKKKGTFKVYAASLQEAEDKVNKFLNR